jgi:signal peptidase I
VGRRFNRLFWVACVAFLMRACVLEPVRTTDETMAPVLQEGEVAFVNKLSYGLRVSGAGTVIVEWQKPRRGDLVVAVSAGDPPLDLLRRISGVPGDKVLLPDGKEAVLQEGEYYLTAEQKEGAMDSRRFGPVPRKAIVGKVSYAWQSKRSSSESGSRVESPKSVWRYLRPL